MSMLSKVSGLRRMLRRAGLTVADNSITLANGDELSAGGGVNYIHQATALLIDAQLKAFTTAIDIVPAPDDANILQAPIYGILSLDSRAGAYSLGAGTYMQTYIVANDGAQMKSLLVGPDEFQNSFYQNAGQAVASCVPDASVPGLTNSLFTFPRDYSAIVGRALAIQLFTDCGDLVDGNIDNTMRVLLAYLKLDMTTGLLIPT